ncbi:CAP domain-containing protein [Kitasatospora sp. NPDC094015]|uniref:CAP domain-containing protein n=1 Tax=Kitasatospora sp. NPDC094015 TaxID=3155205 RepID=UPI0033186750
MDSDFRTGSGDFEPRPAQGAHRRTAPGRAGHRRKPSTRPRTLGAIAGTAALAVVAGGAYTLFGPAQPGSALTEGAAAAPPVSAPDLPVTGGADPGTGTPGSNPSSAAPGAPGTATAGTPAPQAGDPSAAPANPAQTATAAATTPGAAPADRAATAHTGASAPGGATKPAAAKPAPAPPAASGKAAQFAAQVTDLVNAERAKAGCGPVTLNPKLSTAALQHSDDMVARHYFEHADPEGHHADSRIEAAGYRWSSWGENIAYGQADPAAVMDAWMHSEGHRANILNCDFKEIGMGVNFGAGGPWWTQVFAAPR